MPQRRDKQDVLNRDFLEVRGKILEISAALDRLDRAPRSPADTPDPRLAQLDQALLALRETGPGRAETIQRIFSNDYDPRWKERLEVMSR